MGDAAEGLIDADARLQERMEELEESRKAVQRDKGPKVDPEHVRQAESLRLARIELARQMDATPHQVRRDQIGQAIAEIDKRLAAMNKDRRNNELRIQN